MNRLPAKFEVLHFFELPPWNRPWVPLALGFAFAAVDFFTGPYALFPVFFIIPVMLMAWNGSLRYAVGLTIALTFARFGFNFAWHSPLPLDTAILNAILQLSVLLLLAVMTARLSTYTRILRDRVRILEGLLPICGWCKDIRSERGDWERLETYMDKHSMAHFTHGICPKCTEKQLASFAEHAVALKHN